MRTAPYVRKAHYHETDQMGVVYHANYIHWFEEARVDFLRQLDAPYKKLEADGILSPVIAMQLEYRAAVRFDEAVLVYVDLCAFDGVRMEVRYRVVNRETKVLSCTGHSKHCFVNKTGKPVSLKKVNPTYFSVFADAVCANADGFPD